MVGEIISNYTRIFYSIKLFFSSIKEYLEYIINGITVFSSVFAIIIFLIPELHNVLLSNLFILIGFCLIICAILCLHYIHWWNNHFSKISITFDAFFMICGENDNHLIMSVPKLIIPLENDLFFTLKLKFSEFIQSKLFNSFYYLLFKKPYDLEVTYIHSQKAKYDIIEDGIDSPFYCIKLYYKNNHIDELLFKLQAEENIKGKLELYFLIDSFDDDFDRITSKKSPSLIEEIYLEEINIENDNKITISKD